MESTISKYEDTPFIHSRCSIDLSLLSFFMQRLLESLIPSDGSEIDLMDPSALINLRAMVPVQGGVEKDPFMYDAPSPVLESS